MLVIAESAFNHNGDVDYLKNLARAAKDSNADYFTVQVYETAEFCEPDYSKFQICKDVELSHDQWGEIFDYCNEIGIDLIPCVLDIKSFHFCYEHGYRFLKIHATDILNIPFLEEIVKHDCRLILETQCATERDINASLKILNEKAEVLFHGFSDYPTKFEDQNLRSLDYIRKQWPQYKTGFADHTLDVKGIPLMALAKEADYLEKHITLSRQNGNYDWQVSLEPSEFKEMVKVIREYEVTLGKFWKHPRPAEARYRPIMYKKYLGEAEDQVVKRSDGGIDYYENLLSSYDRSKIIITIIARLKSNRLQRKVMLPFKNDLLLFDLMKRLEVSEKISKIILATSFLDEDKELVEEANRRNLPVYPGHPLSVIDRMLDMADQEKAGAVVRITGDNPFTDPEILDIMAGLYVDHDLDYVRANNLPFGVSAEIFSTSYLYRLYNSMENPYQTEYLTWFVMLDDKARKGCVDVNSKNPDLKRVVYSVDYQEDYDRCRKVLSKISKDKFVDITIKDIVENSDFDSLVDLEQSIKLPEGESITFREYFDRLDQMEYVVRVPYDI